MLSAWAVLAAPLAASAFVITTPSSSEPLVAGQNNTIAWNATAPNATESSSNSSSSAAGPPPPKFSIEVKTNGKWVPLGYEFAEVPSDAGAINIQPLGSGYETAFRFVYDGEVVATSEDFVVQPPSSSQEKERRDEPSEPSAAVAPAGTDVSQSLKLAPSDTDVSQSLKLAPSDGDVSQSLKLAPSSGASPGAGASPEAPAPDSTTAPAADAPDVSDAGSPSPPPSGSDASPSASSSESVTKVVNGAGKKGPAPTPGALIVANGTTFTLNQDTQTVEVPAEADVTGETLMHASSSAAAPAPSIAPEDTIAGVDAPSDVGASSSGPLRLINDSEADAPAGSNKIMPGTVTAPSISAGETLGIASVNPDEDSLIMATPKATGAASTAGTKVIVTGLTGSAAAPSKSAGAAAADGASSNQQQGSGAGRLRPTFVLGVALALALAVLV